MGGTYHRQYEKETKYAELHKSYIVCRNHIVRDRVMEVVREIHQLQVEAPVKQGQVLIENILGEKGVHVIACRSMDRVI